MNPIVRNAETAPVRPELTRADSSASNASSFHDVALPDDPGDSIHRASASTAHAAASGFAGGLSTLLRKCLPSVSSRDTGRAEYASARDGGVLGDGWEMIPRGTHDGLDASAAPCRGDEANLARIVPLSRVSETPPFAPASFKELQAGLARRPRTPEIDASRVPFLSPRAAKRLLNANHPYLKKLHAPNVRVCSAAEIPAARALLGDARTVAPTLTLHGSWINAAYLRSLAGVSVTKLILPATRGVDPDCEAIKEIRAKTVEIS